LKTPIPLYAKAALILFTLLAVGFLIIAGKIILSPLVFSMLFSIMLLPAAQFFEGRFKLHRSAASMLSVLLMITVVAAILFLLGSQLIDLFDDWPTLKNQLTNSYNNTLFWIRDHFHVTYRRQENLVNSASDKIVNGGGGSTSAIGVTIITVSSIALFWAFVLIETFFILFYRRLLVRFLISIFKEENAMTVFEVMERIQYIIGKYIAGLMLEMAVVATVCCTVFIIGGVKYALLLGLITGLFNLIPYVGIFTALLLSSLITLSTAGTGKVILVAVTIIIMHIIDSNILMPLIVGSKVRINALITILGVVLGEMLWGISGMFLSIPIIAILKIIFDRVESLQSWGLLLGDEIIEADTIETKSFVLKEESQVQAETEVQKT
jgi:predicted PurR-regulated permease PerM